MAHRHYWPRAHVQHCAVHVSSTAEIKPGAPSVTTSRGAASPLPLVWSVNANYSGWLDTNIGALASGASPNPRFQLQGHGELVPVIGTPIKADVLFNNNVMVACSTTFSAGVVRYWATGTSQVFQSAPAGSGTTPCPSQPPALLATGRPRRQARPADRSRCGSRAGSRAPCSPCRASARRHC